MSLLYDLTVPVYIRGLENLIHILSTAEKWADENNVPQEKLFEARLSADMNPLPFQIWTASNTAKALLPRLAGAEAISMPDDEKTMPQLRERLQKTIDALKTAKPSDFEGKEYKDFTTKVAKDPWTFTGVTYMQRFGFPNFWFHVTTAYAILRAQGVPVGKMDFLGAIQ